MEIEVASRHTQGASKRTGGQQSTEYGGPANPGRLLRVDGSRNEWDFYELHLGSGTGIPMLPECSSTIALVAERSPGAEIEDRPVRTAVHPGDVLLSIGAQMRRFRFSGQIRLYLLAVERSRVLHLAEGDIKELPCVFIPPVHLRDAEIQYAMQELRVHVGRRSLVGQVYCEAYANSIVLRALRRGRSIPLHSSDYKDPLPSATLKTVLEYMYGHVADAALRSGALARLAALPVDVFRHRFRKSLRRSVHQCLIDIRLENAMDRLAHSSRPVSQIAMDTGFADHSHFSRVFRERTGSTPSEFREKVRDRK